MRWTAAFLILAASGTLLAGCGTDTGSGDRTGTGGTSSSPPTRPTTPIVDRSEIVVPTGTTAKPIRLTGRVVEGVESGCTVLRTDAGASYTLAGDLSAVAGATGEVTLEGRIDPDLVSHCQQGPVFVVTAVAGD